MNAVISAADGGLEPQRARLWAGSALAVLLAHLGIAALLFLHIDWKQPILRGTADALDVELAPPSALPPSSATRSTVPQLPQEQQPVRPRPQPQLATVNPVKPLPQLQPIPQQTEELQPPSVTAAATAASMAAAATASVLTAPDLTAFTSSLGQANAPPSPEQAWLTQVIGQMQRYKSYPPGAMKRQQQDRVTLQFSVNRAGQVVYSRIDSKLHYKALEGEVRKMLRLAAPLPAPPPELTEQSVVTVPVDFYLTTLKPALVSCVKPADPGPAPAGARATLEQMRAYRGRFNQYLGAAGSYVTCLGRGTDAATLASHNAAVDQVHALVARFNAQAQAFKTQAIAQAQQAAAARLAQAQAEATRAYDACMAPTGLRPAAADLTADTARSYRKQLVGYESAVRAYLDCIHQAQLASAAQAGNALTAGERAMLDRTTVQRANDAVLPFDQLVVGFNSQLRHLQARARATVIARARELAKQAALVRVPVFFPDSTWDTPAPLPAGNCIRIVRSGGTYQAQLCKGTYVTEHIVHGFNQPPGGRPVLLGTEGAQPNMQTASAESIHPTTTAYAVSALRVNGSHLALIISRKSDAASGSDDDWNSVNFDLALSADGSHLVGHCWTEQKRWDCQLSRHR